MADFAEALRPIWLAKPETASRVKQRCDAVMNWCAARDIIVASPLKVVTALLPAQPGKRERVEHHPTVPWRELPAMCRTLFRDKPETTRRLLLEFVILTACRSGEARGMIWSEIDQAKAIWTIPAGRTATVHGFRSSFRDWASEHAYPRDLAERALSHTSKDAT